MATASTAALQLRTDRYKTPDQAVATPSASLLIQLMIAQPTTRTQFVLAVATRSTTAVQAKTTVSITVGLVATTASTIAGQAKTTVSTTAGLIGTIPITILPEARLLPEATLPDLTAVHLRVQLRPEITTVALHGVLLLPAV